jgi:hypothetical protein
LNLRLALATIGLVLSVIFAVFAFRAGYPIAGWLLVVLAVIAVIDLMVILARRRTGSGGRSLFE